MAYADRDAAWKTFLAAHRTNSSAQTTNNATLVSVMATVSANSITAQNITDINAAIAACSAATTAFQTAMNTAAPALVRPDNVQP